MSDDFFKKISKNQKPSNNPLDQLFQKKKEEIGINKKEEKKTEDKIDGIENLGKTSTKNDFSFDNNTPEQDKDNNIPTKSMENADIFKDNKQVDDNDIDIPAKSMENADIFKDNQVDKNEEFIIKTKASFSDISFDERKDNKIMFNEEIIKKITVYLKENKADDAIKLIMEIKNENSL